MSRSIQVLAIVAATGCGDDLTDADAREVFTLSNDLIHTLHNEAFAMPTWPATFDFACPQGGNIAMTTVFAGAAPMDLLHAFEGCMVEGWTLDGNLDYRGISTCTDGSYSFGISGVLAIAGHGDCESNAQETCGVIKGNTCGVVQ